MENSNIKVSIIMPVYKVEEYVGKAIESIQAQTLKEWEFLIVDDGTPDKSGEICDAYAEKDDRIHVIHKENGGAPSARNMAIEMAKGEYFYFLDSDDWAEPTMLEDMYNLAKRDNAQLVVAGFYIDTYCGRWLYDRRLLCRRRGLSEQGIFPPKCISYLTKTFYIHRGTSCLKQNTLWKITCVSRQHFGMIFHLT